MIRQECSSFSASHSDNHQRNVVTDAAPIELHCSEHAGRLLAALAQLRRDAAYCDVLLRVEREPSEALYMRGVGDGETASVNEGKASNELRGVWAHSSILAAASPFFYAMFKNNFKESTKQVYVKDIDLETIRTLVENIYTPTPLEVSVKDAKKLLAAATLLEVGEVRDAACTCLARALAPDNALGIRASAKLHACPSLVDAATRFIHYHGERVLKENELLALEFNEMTTLLHNNYIAAREDHVFDAVLRWTQHRPQERRRHLGELLQAVQLSLVSRSMLIERALTEPQSLPHIIEALTTNRERPEYRKQIRPRPPRNTQPPVALLVIGGWLDDTGCTDSVLVCSLPGNCWQRAASLPKPRDNAGAALMDGCVYVIGGQESEYSHVRTAFVYDAAINSWRIGPPLGTARGWPGATALAGRLYAAGGWRGTEWHHTEVFNSAEAMDPREGVWRAIASMSTRRSGLGLAALDGMLYAVGGYDGNIQLKSMERYDPVADRWETMEPMAERRDNVRVAVVDHALYAVGGRNEQSYRLRSVERYRAGSGWETAPPMPAVRGNAAVTAHGGRLYAAGGHDGRKRLAAVSIFDPVTGAWSELPALTAPRSAAVAAAVAVAWPAPASLSKT